MNRFLRGGGCRRGFTTVEVLVVVLLVGVALSIAMPLYSSAIEDGNKKACRNTMMAIAAAEQTYHVKVAGYIGMNAGRTMTPVGPNAGAAQAVLQTLPILASPPTCPDGGQYSVSVVNGAFTVSCPQHGTYQPTTDND